MAVDLKFLCVTRMFLSYWPPQAFRKLPNHGAWTQSMTTALYSHPDAAQRAFLLVSWDPCLTASLTSNPCAACMKSVCTLFSFVSSPCVHTWAFLFCVRRVHKQYLLAPCAKKCLIRALSTQCADLIFSVMLMLFAHAFETICEWSSEPSPALFEEPSSWWSSDSQTRRISLPVFLPPVPPAIWRRARWPLDAHHTAEETVRTPTARHRRARRSGMSEEDVVCSPLECAHYTP